MKTLMCQIPNPLDATSFYRGVGPMQSLKRHMGDIMLQIGTDVSWATLKAADVVFLQRPMLDHHEQIVRMALANRKPVWVDYDDDLYRVPRCNPMHKVYGKAKIQNNVSTIVAKADVVTVSTEELANLMRGILSRIAQTKEHAADEGFKLDPAKVVVVPNAYDEEVLAPVRRGAVEQNSIAMWRGSATHDKDLFGFTNEICAVVGNHLDWTFAMVGSPFWGTVEAIQSVPRIGPQTLMLVESMETIDYFNFLTKTRPALMVVPLEDIPFNRCKSNIAWVEATHAGAVTLAPDWPEWQRPGIINYKDHRDFKNKYDRFLRGEFNGYELWSQSRDFIAENLTLSKVNRIRENVLNGLMAKAFER